jgi:ferredoxin
MNAKVNQNCIGCELCTSICPDVFKMGDDGFAHVIVDIIPEEQEDLAREAASSCPVEAIIIS